MACKECRKIQEAEDKIYYYRWGIADIGIEACEQHAREIIDVLNDHQKIELEKQLKEHWENTKEEREKTHTSKIYEKLKKEITNAKT